MNSIEKLFNKLHPLVYEDDQESWRPGHPPNLLTTKTDCHETSIT